jgi:hypothetical protein
MRWGLNGLFCAYTMAVDSNFLSYLLLKCIFVISATFKDIIFIFLKNAAFLEKI